MNWGEGLRRQCHEIRGPEGARGGLKDTVATYRMGSGYDISDHHGAVFGERRAAGITYGS